MARAVSLAGEFRRQPPNALARPTQWGLRISPRRRLDQLLQVRDQRRILIDRTFAPCPRAANPAGRQKLRSARLQLLRPDPNGSPGHASGPRHRRHAAPPYCLGFGRRQQSSHPFIEMLLDELEPPPNRPRVHHPRDNIQSPYSIYGTFIS